MIPKDALRNALREKGYKFKRQADRVEIWKKQGSTDRASLKRCDLHDEDAARYLLRSIGMTPEEIETFIKSTSRPNHLHQARPRR